MGGCSPSGSGELPERRSGELRERPTGELRERSALRLVNYLNADKAPISEQNLASVVLLFVVTVASDDGIVKLRVRRAAASVDEFPSDLDPPLPS